MNEIISSFFLVMKSFLYDFEGPMGAPRSVVPVALVACGNISSKLGYIVSNVWVWCFWVETDRVMVLAGVRFLLVVLGIPLVSSSERPGMRLVPPWRARRRMSALVILLCTFLRGLFTLLFLFVLSDLHRSFPH